MNTFLRLAKGKKTIQTIVGELPADASYAKRFDGFVEQSDDFPRFLHLWNEGGETLDLVCKKNFLTKNGLSAVGQPCVLHFYEAPDSWYVQAEAVCTPEELVRLPLLDLDVSAFKGREDTTDNLS
ncbi:hypothetical protein J4219_06960 [Candidatus Woesearchaeota archaeon]|nr:hypothetical protein [Candidatus Woesearchaeota archaeon]